MIFTRFASSGRPSALALALALAAGTAVGATALATPAVAQDDDDEEAGKPSYSEAFVAAYSPVQELLKAPTPDVAALTAAVPAITAAIETEDDRMAAGSAIYAIGQKTSDQAMQMQGVELMLASGKVPAASQPQYNFLAGQLAFQLEDFAKSRTYVQKAIDLGYTDNDPQVFIAESYFAEDKFAEGLAYLTSAIEARRAAGQPVSEDWIRRGLAMAYNNQLDEEARRYALWYARDYPSNESWGDAIAIALNTSSYEYPEILDLLRLARQTKTFRDANMYLEYIEAADPRKLPGEVVAVIDEGYASGMLDRGDTVVVGARAEAAGRIEADKADLPGLARDARAPGASLATVMAAGNVFLSYGQGAEAEEFYTKALTMAGVNTPLVYTRLGMAQLDQGKFSEAEATFNKVEGARQAIANLWAVYAGQQG